MHPKSLATTKEFHFSSTQNDGESSIKVNNSRAYFLFIRKYTQRMNKLNAVLPKMSKLLFFPNNKFDSIGVVIVAFIHVEQCSCGFVITQLHSLCMANGKQQIH